MSLPDLEGKTQAHHWRISCDWWLASAAHHFRASNWLTQKWRIMRLRQLPFICRTEIQRQGSALLMARFPQARCIFIVHNFGYQAGSPELLNPAFLPPSFSMFWSELRELAGYLSLQQACAQPRGGTSRVPRVGFSGFQGMSSCKFSIVSNTSQDHWHCPTMWIVCEFLVSFHAFTRS